MPPVSSAQFIKVLLTFDFVKRSQGKLNMTMSKAGLNRRVFIPLNQKKLDADIVRSVLSAAGISEKRFILALRNTK